MLKGILEYAHDLLAETVKSGEAVIDATCGNGNDTLFLSKLTGNEGKVIAFDIQEQAIQNTQRLLDHHNRKNVILIQDSHDNMLQYVSPADKQWLGGAIFNLGYLPKGDKTVITTPASTLAALGHILQILKPGRMVVLVVYYGHEGGMKEKEALLQYAIQLDQKQYQVLQYRYINQKNHAPFIIAIQKK
ncbi:methyltransferase domain-containing protein [Ornithinibacillus gellani]|uniref:class I SAM-dependent methyltransferase n=1 Tax=Ornithinibacillus gellani TaxID=2293253 RepID=UPI000F4A83C4|nr:class I SAM-dependent methyltransferase [Ornithinibacillus gellani]TQS75253.1 methyltransferase domain-containing protein [Ornithinibacillus gellani]